jgi:TAG lipase/steryl ester hydrolase/phospholipase A2/LPA acyltransferase
MLIRISSCASCSVPVLFSAATLQAKDIKTGEIGPWNPTPQQWIDGSVDNDLPMTRLAEMFNVNNFIVSQVNPHVVPFLLKEEEFLTSEAQDAHAPSRLRWLQTWTDLAKDEALFRMQELVELGFFPTTLTKCASVMSQKYSGDINIYPEISYSDFPYMLTNPTSEFMLQAALCGERATWPKMSRIQNHMKIELALDDAVKQLQTRVVFSPSQVNLRLNLLGAYGVGRGRGVGFGRRGKSTRSNEPLMSRAEGDRGSTQSLPYHVKSLSMSVIGQSLPTIPGSPDPEPLLEMANRVREGALNSTGVETPSNLSPEPDTAITDAFDDNSDVSRELGSESRRSVSSEGSEGTITQYQHDTATTAHSEPGSSTPRPETPDASDSALSSPTLSIKMPPRPPRNGNPSTPELRYKRLFHQGALPQPILPIVPNTSRGRGDRDPGLSVDLSGTAGDGAPWPSNASPMSWMAAVGLGSR